MQEKEDGIQKIIDDEDIWRQTSFFYKVFPPKNTY